jgi:hypothetical protein
MIFVQEMKWGKHFRSVAGRAFGGRDVYHVGVPFLRTYHSQSFFFFAVGKVAAFGCKVERRISSGCG